MSGTLAIKLRGEDLLLHPDRAVIWPRRATAIVADTHFGKSSVFGRHGIPVPAGADDVDRARLTRLVASHGIRRLLVLGDFLHAPLDPDSPDAQALQSWSSSFTDVEIRIIAGNHDRGISSGWRGALEWTAGSLVEMPFRFVHDDSRKSTPAADLFSFSGHIHPVVALRGLRKRVARVPVFWLRSSGMVLPSFGQFTGGHLVHPAPGEQVFAAGSDQVTAFPPR